MTLEEAIAILKGRDTLRITVSGDIGSGKSTFAKHLAEELDVPRTYIGQIMRELAVQHGVTLDELNKKFEGDDTFDKELDKIQAERSKTTPKGVFEGRVAWHFVESPDVKLFLSVDPQIAAERLWDDRKNPLRDKYNSVEEIFEADEARKQSEEARYQKFYGLSAYDRSNFDVVVDTSDLTIDEVFKTTIIKLAEHLQNSMSKIITTTYKHPDLDGYGCSIAYAELLRATGQDAEAHIWGTPQIEVQWVLETFDIKPALGPVESFDGDVVILDLSDPEGVPGILRPEQVVEIIDHRKISFEDKFPNAASQVELVGAAATLVAEHFRAADVTPSKESALLLYGGIISNTQNLSDTATDRDRVMAIWLKEVSDAPDDFVKQMFKAKSNLSGSKLQEALIGDSKVLRIQDKIIGTAQLEIVGADDLIKNRFDEIQAVLKKLHDDNRCDLTFLNIKDLEENSGRIICVDYDTFAFMNNMPSVIWTDRVGFSKKLTLRKQITAWIDEKLIDYRKRG